MAAELTADDTAELYTLRGENAAYKDLVMAHQKQIEVLSRVNVQAEAVNHDLKQRLAKAEKDCGIVLERLGAIMRGLDMAGGTFDASELAKVWPEWLEAVRIVREVAERTRAAEAAEAALRGDG